MVKSLNGSFYINYYPHSFFLITLYFAVPILEGTALSNDFWARTSCVEYNPLSCRNVGTSPHTFWNSIYYKTNKLCGTIGWHSFLVGITFWLALLFGWHYFMVDITLWFTLLFGWQYFWINITFWLTLLFIWYYFLVGMVLYCIVLSQKFEGNIKNVNQKVMLTKSNVNQKWC